MAKHKKLPDRKSIIDISGKTFNYLKVLSFVGVNEKKFALWLCECLLCGKEKICVSQHIRDGRNKSCGCRVPSLINRRFGRLVVLRKDKTRSSHWVCLCDCGGEKTAHRSDLLSGDTKSCGCIWRNGVLK